MMERGPRRVRRTKEMTCGHSQEFVTPVPQQGDWVWCRTCDNSSRLPPRPRAMRVADGRKRRLLDKPKSNNQWTKGRQLSL